MVRQLWLPLHHSTRRLGRNGCSVPEVSKQQEKDITAWFDRYGVVRDATATNMWWFMKRFSHQCNIGNGPDRIVSGGYEFRMSKDAFNVIKANPE